MSLTSSEQASLESGIADLASLGHDLLVSFDIRKLPRAQVVWLNDRWFTHQGLPIGIDANLRARAERWVLEAFAVSTGDGGPDGHAEKRTAHADRYGDPRGTSPHGGSGRVATIGRFQVKGVGPTPLVGDATWVHSHGHMSMTEAIAEAIYGELLDEELPFGAVPVIAIIDTGETVRWGETEARRGLIVRPAPFRPAHLLRAPMFAPSPALAPSRDAVRTREAISTLASMSDEQRSRLRIPANLADLLTRLVKQTACCEALRIYTGGLFAQNVSMDGALLDFGVARTLYTWVHLQLHSHAQGFGRDLDRLVNSASAMQFFARKAGVGDSSWFRSPIDRDAEHQACLLARRRMFGKIWADELFDESTREVIRDATQRYFVLQQRLTLRERWDGKRPDVDWIHDALVRDQAPGATTTAEQFACEVRAAILGSGAPASARTHAWRSAARLLQPRPELDRTRFEHRVTRLFRDVPDTDRAPRVAKLVVATLARCRRWWPALPAELAVVTQRFRGGCAALEVIDLTGGKNQWWLEGLLCDDRLVWGRTFLSDSDVQALQPEWADRRWHARCNRDRLPAGIAKEVAELPSVTYREPPGWWM